MSDVVGSAGAGSGRLNQRLREAMQSIGLTDRGVADRLNVASSTFSSWMTGRAPWRPQELYALCGLLNIDPWWAASELGLLPGDAAGLLLDMKSAAMRPLLIDVLEIREEGHDPVGKVVAAIRAAGFDASTFTHLLGREHRRPAHTWVSVNMRPGEKHERTQVRRAVEDQLKKIGGSYAHWEENVDLLPDGWPGAHVLVVEDVFGPRAPRHPVPAPQGPYYVGGVYYTGANLVPRFVHDLVGFASVDVSAAFTARVHEAPFAEETFVQEAIVMELLRFSPFDEILATADDFQVLTRALRRLEAGQWRPRGTFLTLVAEPRLLEYAAFHCARSVQSDAPDKQAASVEWWADYLQQGQDDLIDVTRRLFGTRSQEVNVSLPKGIKQQSNGTWRDEVDLLFDRDWRTAEAIADVLDPQANGRRRRARDMVQPPDV